MKIAVLCHREADYGATGIILGAYDSVGTNNIIEFPYARHLHGGVDNDYVLPDGKMGYTGPPAYMIRPLPPNERSEEEFLDTIKDMDWIVATSCRSQAIAALDLIVARLGKLPENLILCDGEDTPMIREDLIERFKPITYLKRELYTERPFSSWRCSYPPTEIWPLPFAAYSSQWPEDIDDSEEGKQYDLFLSLGITHGSRNILLHSFIDTANRLGLKFYVATNQDALSRRSDGRLASYFKDMLSWPEYMRMQAQSRIGGSIRGFGRDALHAWELASFRTCMIYIKPRIYMPYPFIDGIHCVKDDEACETIPHLIERLIQEPGLRWQIATNGCEHLRRYHTAARRFQYAIDVATRIRDGKELVSEIYGF